MRKFKSSKAIKLLAALIIFLSSFTYIACANSVSDSSSDDETESPAASSATPATPSTPAETSQNPTTGTENPDITKLSSQGKHYKVEATSQGFKFTINDDVTSGQNTTFAFVVYDTEFNQLPLILDLNTYINNDGSLNQRVFYYHFVEKDKEYYIKLRGEINGTWATSPDWTKCTATGGYKLSDYVNVDTYNNLTLDITYNTPEYEEFIENKTYVLGQASSIKLTCSSDFSSLSDLIVEDKIGPDAIQNVFFDPYLIIGHKYWSKAIFGGTFTDKPFLVQAGVATGYNQSFIDGIQTSGFSLDWMHYEKINYAEHDNKYCGEIRLYLQIMDSKYTLNNIYSEEKDIETQIQKSSDIILQSGPIFNRILRHVDPDNSAKSFMKSSTAPGENVTKYEISQSNSSKTVYMWKDDETVYYYADTQDQTAKIYLNCDANHMFSGSKIETIDLSGLDTSKVTNMSYMFGRCEKLTSLNLAYFDTSNVTDMKGMFSSCLKLTSLSLSNFDTSKVTDMRSMFMDDSLLEKIYASENFITTNVTLSQDMFYNCQSLVGGNNTQYSFEHVDAEYARIDGGPGSSTPGYFTSSTANN